MAIFNKIHHRLLVTGSDGFIGQNLHQFCCSQSIDTVQYGARNLKLKGLSAQEYVETGNWMDSAALRSAVQNVDTLIHLAGLAHIPLSSKRTDADELCAHNTKLTQNLVEILQESPVNHLIFISTAKVMGASSSQPFSEQDEPHLTDAYSQSKWQAEQLLMQAAQRCDLKYTILRPPLVYGPGVKANFLQLIKLARSPLPLPFASVHNRRSVLFVGNLIHAILSCVGNPAAYNETFFVGDAKDLSTAELICQLRAAMGRKPGLYPMPVTLLASLAKLLGQQPKMSRLLQDFQLDTSHIQQKLGWQPPYQTTQSMRLTLEAD